MAGMTERDGTGHDRFAIISDRVSNITGSPQS
ncbi:hypothetical protein QFZ67_007862 [Streptomyces sp. V1I1]|nr:hypothetical protein [Streptomyces sp. V1I1]